MGKKYIVELGRCERLYKAYINGNGMPNMTWLSPEVDLTPYTEPDLERVKKTAHDDGYSEGYQAGRGDLNRVMSDVEQVRTEEFENGYENGFVDGHLKAEKSGQKFYEDGYQRGLTDAWEAARKICCSVTAGGLNYNTLNAVFGSRYPEHIVATFTASEVIERLKQFEQKQEESKKEQSVTTEDVMRQYLNEFCKKHRCSKDCVLNTDDFTCGRGNHFTTDSPVSDEEVRRAYAKVVKER